MTDDPAAERAIGALYHAAPSSTRQPTLRYGLLRSGEGYVARVPVRPPFGPAALEDAWAFIEWRATEDVLAAEREWACLHAGGVQVGRSNALIIGASGSGKSTMVAHLMAAGHRVWGDDLVCFAPKTGQFSAFPRSLKLDDKALSGLALAGEISAGAREGTLVAPPVTYLSPEAFRADWQAPAGSVRALVLLSADRHQGSAVVEPASEGAAAILATQSIIAGSESPEHHTIMIRVLEAMRDAAAWRISGASPAANARALEEALADE